MMDGPHLALAGDALYFRVVAPIHCCTFTVQINDKKIYGWHASGLPDFFFFFFMFLFTFLLFSWLSSHALPHDLWSLPTWVISAVNCFPALHMFVVPSVGEHSCNSWTPNM